MEIVEQTVGKECSVEENAASFESNSNFSTLKSISNYPGH